MLAQYCIPPPGAETVLILCHTISSQLAQQPPRAKLGWGCLILEEQVGREGTGTLPELLLYK